ncbi:MAG: VOC family protein, partial [Chloroflexota bacterium]
PGEPEVELTYNWDQEEEYTNGRNFGHLAFAVDNIYELCQSLQDNGVTILRPPKEGRMAFIKSPDGISIELLQKGDALPIQEPWVSMPNTGSW